MFLLKHVLSVAMFTLVFSGIDPSLRVDRAVAPTHPLSTVASGAAVVQIDLDRNSGKLGTTVLRGEPPFASAALNAVMHWTFTLPPESRAGRTSVTFFFRAPRMRPDHTLAIPVSKVTGPDRPALPVEIMDPGYPMMSEAEGAVIFELKVDAAGIVTDAMPLLGVSGLTEQAQDAVLGWRFSPATVDGTPTASSVFAVVSFVLPM